MYILQD